MKMCSQHCLVRLSLREVSRTTYHSVENSTYKLWNDSMTFVYYGGQDAVEGCTAMDERGSK